MKMLRHLRAGEVVAVDQYNALVDAINELKQFSVSAPLTMSRGPMGVHLGVQRPFTLRKGKLDQPLAYRSSAGAVVSLYGGIPGSESVTGEKPTAFDWHLLPGESLDAGITVTVARIDSFWYVVAAACDPDPNITAPGGGGGGGAGGGSSGSTATLVSQPTNSNPALWPSTTMAFPWGN